MAGWKMGVGVGLLVVGAIIIVFGIVTSANADTSNSNTLSRSLATQTGMFGVVIGSIPAAGGAYLVWRGREDLA